MTFIIVHHLIAMLLAYLGLPLTIVSTHHPWSFVCFLRLQKLVVSAFSDYNVSAFSDYNVSAFSDYNVSAFSDYNVSAFSDYNVSAFSDYKMSAFFITKVNNVRFLRLQNVVIGDMIEGLG
ncbi:uncharacterized protein LACBIDRAFT_329163 [Laccaria bicolor S238N-H82]|uniref:Predicted protein n=1 Tax=Laccaria bicolor (strain S238N-H82 / ATCC MYA-4686) TaxID=486041 RepID=B0DH90_LACBS|nr:uncharacterized protein LACBIDRAFT_329163 [Laccaria bicolor S238N-H82]EDR05973.1 predicted protein [Laccaria bicolor S238N-H82]|eukprot:XP_001883261.1 predicted protein [Laccaria bicolor S238N-H82]